MPTNPKSHRLSLELSTEEKQGSGWDIATHHQTIRQSRPDIVIVIRFVNSMFISPMLPSGAGKICITDKHTRDCASSVNADFKVQSMRSERPDIRIDRRSSGRSTRHLDGSRVERPRVAKHVGEPWRVEGFGPLEDARRNPSCGAWREAKKLGVGVSGRVDLRPPST